MQPLTTIERSRIIAFRDRNLAHVDSFPHIHVNEIFGDLSWREALKRTEMALDELTHLVTTGEQSGLLAVLGMYLQRDPHTWLTCRPPVAPGDEFFDIMTPPFLLMFPADKLQVFGIPIGNCKPSTWFGWSSTERSCFLSDTKAEHEEDRWQLFVK